MLKTRLTPLRQVRARYDVSKDAPLVLSVGRLIPQKGPDILVCALPKLLESHPDVVVMFVGEKTVIFLPLPSPHSLPISPSPPLPLSFFSLSITRLRHRQQNQIDYRVAADVP